MTSNVLLCDSVACFVNGNFCFTRSQQLIPVEKSLYLVKTDFASVQVRRVRGLEKKIYSIFTKKVPQGSFCESPVMKWTVIYHPFQGEQNHPASLFPQLPQRKSRVRYRWKRLRVYLQNRLPDRNVKDLL